MPTQAAGKIVSDPTPPGLSNMSANPWSSLNTSQQVVPTAAQYSAAKADPSSLVDYFLSLPQGSAQQYNLMDSSLGTFLNGNPKVQAAFGGQNGLNTWINNASSGALPGQPNAATAIGSGAPG